MAASIGDRINLRRKALGMTLEDVAKAIGVVPSAISNWEHRRSYHPRLETLEKLAKALNTTPSYLMGFEEMKKEGNMDYFDEAIERLRKVSDILYKRVSGDVSDLSLDGYCLISREIRAINEQIVMISGIRDRKNNLPRTTE